MKKLLSFGEIIFDAYGDEYTLGGAPLNLASHTAKFGIPSYILSALGGDALGEGALGEIASLCVNTELVQKKSLPTGRCEVTLDACGVPSFTIKEGVAYDEIDLQADTLLKIKEISPDILYFGTLIQRSEKTRNSLKKLINAYNFSEIVCDINLRRGCYTADSIETCLSCATILKVSDSEADELISLGFLGGAIGIGEALGRSRYEEFAGALFAKYEGLKIIIITLGADGCFVADKRGECVSLGAIPAEAVSTVGAGDSFLGAFLASYLSGRSLTDSAKIATEVAAFVVSRKEAVPPYTVLDGRPIFK